MNYAQTCPNCQLTVYSFRPVQAEAECPFCHQRIHQLTEQMTKPSGCAFGPDDLYVPPTLGCQELREQLVQTLSQLPYTPVDVFSLLPAEGMERLWLPLYRYQGEYEVPWRCQQRLPADPAARGEGHAPRWQETQGTARGTFSLLLPAHAGKDLPAELRDFAEALAAQAGRCEALAAHTQGGPVCCEQCVEGDRPTGSAQAVGAGLAAQCAERGDYAALPTVQAERLWASRGMKQARAQVAEAVRSHCVQGRARAWKLTPQLALTGQPVLVWVPVNALFYLYQGRRHYFLSSPDGSLTAQRSPIDRRLKWRHRQLRVAMLCSALVALAAAGLAFFHEYRYLALALVGVGLVCSIIFARLARTFLSRKKKAQKKGFR